MATTPTRKGASKTADIPADVLVALNKGTMQSATLVEGLAIDFASLLSHAYPALEGQAHELIDNKQGITKRMVTVGQLLFDANGLSSLDELQQHESDTVRGWGAYVIGAAPTLTLKKRLSLISQFADDSHFGVREWAWLALRPYLVENPTDAIALLTPWVKKRSPYLRRFAVEAIRPRGVWCSHIALLKTSPELAMPLLEPLKNDPERYVQDSVANWLNDASKTQPQWVIDTCQRFTLKSDTAATAYITKRAQRSL